MDQELSCDARLIQPFLRNGRNTKPALPALKRRAIVGQSLRDNKLDLRWGWESREGLGGKKPVWTSARTWPQEEIQARGGG